MTAKKHINPPKCAVAMLRQFLKQELHEEVLGDLDEKFYQTLHSKSKIRTQLNYWYQAINYLRPFALKNYTITKTPFLMYKHNLKIAFRHLSKNKGYSSINIFSLTVGIAAFMAIFLFIKDETSFDKFHSKGNNIYRLAEVQNFTGTKEQKVALSMPGMGPNMLADFPEVINYSRFYMQGKQFFSKEELGFTIDKVYLADSTFFTMFDFELLMGDHATVLNEPDNIILTETSALKFFSSLDEAMNNTLNMADKTLKITGIVADNPEHSHIQFDALGSITAITRENADFNDQWGSNFLNTYLLLEEHSSVPDLEAKLDDFMIRHMDNPDVTDYYELFLQPLYDVHLQSADIEHDYNNYRKFNGTYISTFLLVGVFILIIAGINFMNLTMARASHRWKEVGVRKSVGGLRSQLFGQFIMESMLLSVLALAFAFIINLISLPFLNQLIGRTLSLHYFLQQPAYIAVAVIFALLLGFITGLYPALYMTAFNVVTILKGNKVKGERSFFRSGLVVLQFGLALAMIVSTLIVLQQLRFMQSKDVGFTTDQIVLVDMNQEANEAFEEMKNELLDLASIGGVTASGQRLGNNFHQWGFKVKTDTGLFNMTPSNVFVEHDYLDVYGIQLKEGRSFSKEIRNDEGLAYIINDKLAKELGLDDPVGTSAAHSWYPDDSLGSIIGVTENFNFNSLHHRVNTLAISVHSDWGFDEMSIKITGDDIQGAIVEIENIWSKHVQEWPFDYSFLHQHLATLYESDRQMSAVVGIITILAIIIACMGLFGLSSIMISRRIKEVGIRKTLGASVLQIVVLLSKNFLWLILIAFLIVSPITYYVMTNWLQNFAFQIQVNVLLFIIGVLVAASIALLTISYHTIKASYSNPVDALRYE